METCNNTCHQRTGGNGFLIVLVIYILLAILLSCGNRTW